MLIVTGATPGVEEAAVEAARATGFMVKGVVAAEGKVIGGLRTEFALRHDFTMLKSPHPHEATKELIEQADLIIYLGNTNTRHYENLVDHASKTGALVKSFKLNSDLAGYAIAFELLDMKPWVVFITGDREDRSPGIKEKAKRILLEALRRHNGYRTEDLQLATV